MKIEINNGTLKVNDQVILYDDEEKVDTNHTLEELKQRLINYLYNKEEYDMEDILLIKILFE